ncbi:protein translocase subunit yajC [Desulfosporosinus acidiphilus SJ4]|uniref:Protein translocase subunit yajC n=1 Tax=Desulfosporosinus acidiphilus (strain DSM 22704 / JCM 16185 / SJ4) TaxID=646529 RepID=I4D997_DESAJ|nr:preprotein translocase subunit YajC [Desulfosporosinus acidiphilus]AFM42371.1 protein translocase subunit yajC [Desulfosporosinus acidiphilus SJ4]
MNQSTMSLVLYFVVFFGIMYFLMIRPQQKQAKQRQALLAGMRVRDRVLTSGGIYGKITKVKDNSVMLQIADKVEIEVAKSAITSVENRDINAEDPKKNAKKNDKNDKNDKTNNKEINLEKEDSQPNDSEKENA